MQFVLTGKLKGLTGNFDLDSANDFTSSTGVPEETVFSFGNSWKLGVGCLDVPPEYTHPCQINSQKGMYFISSFEKREKLNKNEFQKVPSLYGPKYQIKCFYHDFVF